MRHLRVTGSFEVVPIEFTVGELDRETRSLWELAVLEIEVVCGTKERDVIWWG
jgi:hypothetical protein